MGIRFAASSLLVLATLAAAPSVALAATTEATVTVTMKGRGELGFAVTGPGLVKVRATGPGLLELRILAPNGAVSPTVTGEGVADASMNVTSEMLAKGKLFTAEVRAPRTARKVAANVKLTAEFPGNPLGVTEMKALPEVASRTPAPQSAVVLPPKTPTPSPRPTVEVAKGVLATFKGTSNMAAIGKAPLRVASISSSSPPAPSGDAASSGYPPPSVKYPPITSVALGSGAPCNGYRGCTVHKGDVVVLSGHNFNATLTDANQPKKVTFFYFSSNKEITVDVVGWSDTLIVATLPDTTGLPDQAAAVYVGAPGGTNNSSPYGLFYQQTLVSQYIDFAKCDFGPSVGVGGIRQHSYAGDMTRSWLGAGVGPGGIIYEVSKNPLTWGVSGWDLVLEGARLKNGWKVKNVVFRRLSTGLGHADAWVDTSSVGTDNPEVDLWFEIGILGSLTYDLSIEIEGEAGTAPYDVTP